MEISFDAEMCGEDSNYNIDPTEGSIFIAPVPGMYLFDRRTLISSGHSYVEHTYLGLEAGDVVDTNTGVKLWI